MSNLARCIKTSANTVLEQSFPVLHRALGQSNLRYYLHLPETLTKKTRVMVCVHGISRNAKEQLIAFRQQASEADYILVAPYFSKKHYRGYQRLEAGSAGYTSAEALNKILYDVGQRFGIDTRKFALFGYSGGAQFAHRYAMLSPERIDKLIITSAGWYTFPDKQQKYPYGLKSTQSFPVDLSANLAAFLKLKIRTLVGELDNVDDPGLNRSQQISRQQGYHRLERAKRWVCALQNACHELGVVSDLHFITIKGCGHSFESCERFGNISKYLFTPDN